MMSCSDELVRLYVENGRELRPSDVVEFARANPESALHAALEWNNEVAGEAYRRYQARKLIQRVIAKMENDESEQIRRFVSVRRDQGEQVFREIRDARANPDEWRQVQMDALRDMRAFQAKYQRLVAVHPVIRAMDDAARALRDEMESVAAQSA